MNKRDLVPVCEECPAGDGMKGGGSVGVKGNTSSETAGTGMKDKRETSLSFRGMTLMEPMPGGLDFLCEVGVLVIS